MFVGFSMTVLPLLNEILFLTSFLQDLMVAGSALQTVQHKD